MRPIRLLIPSRIFCVGPSKTNAPMIVTCQRLREDHFLKFPSASYFNNSSATRTFNRGVKSAVDDIVKLVNNFGGKIPLKKIMVSVTPSTREIVAKSGKGIEGFLLSNSDTFSMLKEKDQSGQAQKFVGFSATFQPPSQTFELEAEIPPLPVLVRGKCVPASIAALVEKEETDVVLEVDLQQQQLLNSELQVALESAMQAERKYSIEYIAQRIFGSKPDPNKVMIVEKHAQALPKHFTVNGFQFVRHTTQHDVQQCRPKKQIMQKQLNPHVPQAPLPSPKAAVNDTRVHLVSDLEDLVKPEWITEILSYVPADWTHIARLYIPNEVRGRCLRQKSLWQFMLRRPQYFDVSVNGPQLYCRRSPLLDPLRNGMTKEQAVEYVQTRFQTAYVDELTKAVRCIPGSGWNNKSG